MLIVSPTTQDFHYGSPVCFINIQSYPYPAAAGLWTIPSDLAILVIELFNSLKGRSTIGISYNAAREIIMINTDLEVHQLKGIISEKYIKHIEKNYFNSSI